MQNYVKSECYRVVHSKEMYLFTAVMSALTIAMNAVLAVADKLIPDFWYGSVNFSLSFLAGSLSWMFMAGLVVVFLLFGDERKCGTLKNTIAYGISRNAVFAGKCIVSVLAAFVSMAVILVFFMGSACLLLKGPAEAAVIETLKGVASALPSAIAFVILAVAILEIFQKEITAGIAWVAVVVGIPTGCFIAGLKIEFLKEISEYMPWNFFKYEVVANRSGIQGLWDTPSGLTRCVLAGLVGIVVFTAFGMIKGRKTEV